MSDETDPDFRLLRNIGDEGVSENLVNLSAGFFSSDLMGLLLLRNIGEGGEPPLAESLFIRSES